MKNHRRFELLLLVTLLSALALIAGRESVPEPKSSAPAQPRVAIDGVALGDSLGMVSHRWGELDTGQIYGALCILRPVSELDAPSSRLGSRQATIGLMGGVEMVGGRCLTVDGSKLIELGDALDMVEERLGPPEPPEPVWIGHGLDYPDDNGYVWRSYQKHRVWITLALINESNDGRVDGDFPRYKVHEIELRYASKPERIVQ